MTPTSPTDGPSVTADTITDRQIRQLKRETTSMSVRSDCSIALGVSVAHQNEQATPDDERAARSRCAAAINARGGAR